MMYVGPGVDSASDKTVRLIDALFPAEKVVGLRAVLRFDQKIVK